MNVIDTTGAGGWVPAERCTLGTYQYIEHAQQLMPNEFEIMYSLWFDATGRGHIYPIRNGVPTGDTDGRSYGYRNWP